MREESSAYQQTMERINRCGFKEKVGIKSEADAYASQSPGPMTKINCTQRKLPVSSASSSSVRFSAGLSAAKVLVKSIKLGETFQSFGEVSQAITTYEKKNKVRLTQKYFRRIAANPKPSNKEDYMLTEEERKRFVYRWVDFCCTYFDDILARADPDNKEDSGTTQVLGLAMKECPMRIRFQLRCNERDLMISIFKEEHDHVHPTGDVPQLSDPSNKANDPVALINCSNPSDVPCPKRPRTQPPSLAPISSLKSLAASLAAQTKQTGSECDRRPPVIEPLNLKSRTHFNSSTHIPKPPPLKAMPLLSCNAESPNESPNRNVSNSSLSAENIVRNIYLHLCRMQATGFALDNGLRFTSANPDLIKIASDLSGVDASQVSAICRAKRRQDLERKTTRTDDQTFSTSITVSKASSSRTHLVKQQNNSVMNRLNDNQSTNIHPNWTSSNIRNQQIQERGASLLDTGNSFVNLPLEVIIKSEPDEPFDYYDENDSQSDMMAAHDDYVSTDQMDAPR